MSASRLAVSADFPTGRAGVSSPRPPPEHQRAAQQGNDVDNAKCRKQRPVNRVIEHARAGPCETSADNGATHSTNEHCE